MFNSFVQQGPDQPCTLVPLTCAVSSEPLILTNTTTICHITSEHYAPLKDGETKSLPRLLWRFRHELHIEILVGESLPRLSC